VALNSSLNSLNVTNISGSVATLQNDVDALNYLVGMMNESVLTLNTTLQSTMEQLNETSSAIFANLTACNQSIFYDLEYYNSSIFQNFSDYSNLIMSNFQTLNKSLVDEFENYSNSMSQDMIAFNFTANVIFQNLWNYNITLFQNLSDYNDTLFIGLLSWSVGFETTFNETATNISKQQDQECEEINQLNFSITSLQINVTQVETNLSRVCDDVNTLQKTLDSQHVLLQRKFFPFTQQLSCPNPGCPTANTYAPYPLNWSFTPSSNNSTIIIDAQIHIFIGNFNATVPMGWSFWGYVQFIINGTNKTTEGKYFPSYHNFRRHDVSTSSNWNTDEVEFYMPLSSTMINHAKYPLVIGFHHMWTLDAPLGVGFSWRINWNPESSQSSLTVSEYAGVLI